MLKNALFCVYSSMRDFLMKSDNIICKENTISSLAGSVPADFRFQSAETERRGYWYVSGIFGKFFQDGDVYIFSFLRTIRIQVYASIPVA